MTAGYSFIYSDLGDALQERQKFIKSIEEYFDDASDGQVRPFINLERLDRFCQQVAMSVRRAEPPDYLGGFPHIDGFIAASVFKKLANFIVLFCEICPIEGVVGDDGLIYTLGGDSCRNYENTSYALSKALALLKDARIERQAPEPHVVLVEPIKLSQHSFDGAAEILQDYHMRSEEDAAIYGQLDVFAYRRRSVRRYKYWAFLLEQMTYVRNPDAKYADQAGGLVSAK